MRISFRKHIAPYLIFAFAFGALFMISEPLNFMVFYICLFFSILTKKWGE